MADADDVFYDVLYAKSDFSATDSTQLSLETGDVVNVLERTSDEWWWVELTDMNDERLVGYVPVNHLSKDIPFDEEERWENDEYFSSYGQIKLHSEMLNDIPRTSAYLDAIQSASPWIRDKVILDVGSGTGILSLFCARYGRPKKVYAVECSDIAVQSREAVARNGYEEFEYMIESVIQARDKFLKPEGVIWPSEAELFLTPCSAYSAYHSLVGIWKDAYGFDFSPYLPLAADTLAGKPLYNHILSSDECLSEPFTVLQLNMKTVTVPQLEEIGATYDFLVKKSGVMHGFASWFAVHFNQLPHPHSPVTLSTSPSSRPTHWKQDLLLLDAPIQVEKGQRLKGSVWLKRHKLWRRHLRIKLNYSVWEDGIELNEAVSKVYRLWR